jgi:phage anti-repressor protein
MKDDAEVKRMDGLEGLKIIESSIVPIYTDKEERMLVNARDLHIFLESRQEFAHWIRNRLEKFSFQRDEDYLITLTNRVGDGIGKPRTEYLLSFDTAKELAMLESNAKGRMIRKYFIECERRLRTACGTINAEAAEKLRQQEKYLAIMDRNARSRQAQILKSAAEFFKAILSNASMQALVSEITTLVTGKCFVDLPKVEELYSAAEIGKMCGISANMVGRIANELGLKTGEYGAFAPNESPGGGNQVTTFQYKLKAAEKIREFLDAVEKISAEDDVLEEEFDLSCLFS